MKGTMKVAVMNGIGKMGYTTRPIPTPKEDEVLVKLEYVGICGSDMHYYETGAIGNYVVKPPFVLGHEPGGTVVEVGSAVKHGGNSELHCLYPTAVKERIPYDKITDQNAAGRSGQGLCRFAVQISL